MPSYHIAVLEREVCSALLPPAEQSRSVGEPVRILDVTCGGGGHSSALARTLKPDLLVALDRDTRALEETRQRLELDSSETQQSLILIHGEFAEIEQHAGHLGPFAAILADFGVSSYQLDTDDRGFSFRRDAPLDMRMDRSRGPTCAQWLAEAEELDIARVLREFGEERDAKRIARAIHTQKPTRTLELAQIVSDAMSARQRRELGLRIHPATKTFQALRMAVNDELGQIERFLACAPNLLAPGGRLACITFHSLEDRRTKRHFANLSRPKAPPAHLPIASADLPRPGFRIPDEYRRGRTASPEELQANPRSRSARLRVLERSRPS